VALEVDEVEQEQPLELEALVQDQQVQVDNLEEVEIEEVAEVEAVAVGHHLAVLVAGVEDKEAQVQVVEVVYNDKY
jgi:hypothetical protein